MLPESTRNDTNYLKDMRVPSFAFNLTCIELFYVPRFSKFKNSSKSTPSNISIFKDWDVGPIWPLAITWPRQRLLIELIGWTLSFHNYDFKRFTLQKSFSKPSKKFEFHISLVTFPNYESHNEILKVERIKNIDIIWYYMKSYDFLAWRGLSYLIKLGLITKYIYPICQPLPLPLNYVSLSL